MNFRKIVNKMVSILLLAALMLNSRFLSGIAYADTNQTSDALASNETEISSNDAKDNTNNTNNTNNRDGVSILNYLTVKAYELSENKENYLELEKIQNLIYNGININVLQDDDTKNFVVDDFLPTITNFKLDSNARSRILAAYKEDIAMSITKGVLATSQAMTSIDTSNIAGGIVGGVGAAATGVSTAILARQEAEAKQNEAQFELIQKSVKNIDNLKTKLLKYMIDLSKNSGIDDAEILRESDIKEFYKAKISTNIYNKIDKLKDAKNKLKNYGPYWLELSKANYQMAREENSNDYYKNCIEAFEQYEKIGTRIYRNGTDMEKYKFIPTYLEAVEIVKPNEYIRIASKYAGILDELSKDQENWEIIYYLVALYEKLHSKTSNISYLDKAYETMRKLTVDVATIFKNNKDLGSYNDTVAISIIKLKEIADKLNKGENDKSSLDKQIFGENGLFGNICIEYALLFSEARKASIKRKIENLDPSEIVDVYTSGGEGGRFNMHFDPNLFIEGVSYASIEYEYPQAGVGWGGHAAGSGTKYIDERTFSMGVLGLDRDGARVKITFEPFWDRSSRLSLKLMNIPDYKYEMVFERRGDINGYYTSVSFKDLTKY